MHEFPLVQCNKIESKASLCSQVNQIASWIPPRHIYIYTSYPAMGKCTINFWNLSQVSPPWPTCGTIHTASIHKKRGLVSGDDVLVSASLKHDYSYDFGGCPTPRCLASSDSRLCSRISVSSQGKLIQTGGIISAA